MRAPNIVLVAAIAIMAVAPAVASPRAKARTLQRRRPATLAASNNAAAQDCLGKTVRCLDCSTLLQCTHLGSVYRPLRTAACPAATPYCSAGSCQAAMPDDSCLSAPTPSAAFVCNGDGYYPDPASCRRYWMCSAGKAYPYECAAAGSVYSQRHAMCVPSSEAQCGTVRCSDALVGVYQRYAADPEVYAVCVDAVAANALMAACPANYTIDPATGDCVITCLSEGRLADTGNSTRYYECQKTGATAYSSPLLLMCPPGSTFSADRQRCLTGSEDSEVAPQGDKAYNEDYYAPDDNVPESQYNLPADLLVGAASSAYQVEGAWNASDKTPSIWDVFFHSRPGLANGDVADDSYHKYLQDVQMLKDLNLQFYRFSISWPRLLPRGDSGQPSVEGTQYYNDLINALIAKGIEPVVTLYHWDLPQSIQNGGGWLNADIQDQFVDYASYCFQTFGDRVKNWMIINEPQTACIGGYEDGYAPPNVKLPGTGGYLCSHNMVLAHAKTYRAYKTNFASQGGRLGSAINIEYPEPTSTRKEDMEAAERLRLWRYAWFADPLYFGDYPAEMRRIIDSASAAEGRSTSRLPTFTDEEKTILKGAMDFLGLNLYSATMASAPKSNRTGASYYNDMQVEVTSDPNWIPTSGPQFYVTPFALADMARWIKDRYDNFPVWVSENGFAGAADEGTKDQKRIGFYSGYMRGLMQAINRDKCNVIAYTAWCLADNLEWGFGYNLKFGLVHVDFSDPERPRTLKDSSKFIQQVMSTRYVSYVKAT